MASLSPLKLNLLVVFGSLWDRFWGGTPLRASIVGTPDKRQARRLDFGGILVDCGVRWGSHFPHVWCFFSGLLGALFWDTLFGGLFAPCGVPEGSKTRVFRDGRCVANIANNVWI